MSLRRGRLVHLPPAFHRTGEGDEIHGALVDELADGRVADVYGGHQVLGQTGLAEGLDERVAAERREARMLDEDGVAGRERRNDDVHGDQQRIVPGRNVEHDAERLAAYVAAEAFLGRQQVVLQGGGRQAQHGLGAVEHGVHFARA